MWDYKQYETTNNVDTLRSAICLRRYGFLLLLADNLRCFEVTISSSIPLSAVALVAAILEVAVVTLKAMTSSIVTTDSTNHLSFNSTHIIISGTVHAYSEMQNISK